MRSVSFVKHLKLNVGGKVSRQCMALGDVDGDNCNELLVALSNGRLEIYKADGSAPWWELNNLGDISCVTIGDVCNVGKDSVIVFTRNGRCSIIDFCSSSNHTIKCERLISNIIGVLIGDFDKDGKQELVTCHSDKTVSAFRWNERLKKFYLLQRWRLRHLAGNVTLHVASDDGRPSIMVSQPGCSYAVLKIDWINSDKPRTDAEFEKSDADSDKVQYTALSSRSRLQNPAISCNILGDIKKCGKEMAGYFALCTLDGTLKLMEEDNILWSLQVDHQLFALNKMDVLGDNREEVIVCAWDGQTYIVDHDRNVVRYHFQDNVQAFCAGQFCVDGTTNLPCLVYADFHNTISLYYDVKLPYLRATDLVSLADKDKEMVNLFKRLDITTTKDKITLLRNCLHNVSDEAACSSNKETNVENDEMFNVN